MNEGMISKRYAKALFEFAVESKVEDLVLSEMRQLSIAFKQEKRLRMAMDNPMLTDSDKTELIKAAIGGKTSKQTERFIELVLHKNRESFFHIIALSYVELYYKMKNINTSRLVTATEVDDATMIRIQALLQKVQPGEVRLETEVDPSIGGGFVLYVDTYRLDASVKSQLQQIKKELIAGSSSLS